jgi:drug/metabolite transporter (DMT)-like permease
MSKQLRAQVWPGVPLALGSAVLFGASAPLSKAMLGLVNPWLLAGLLYLGAGLGLAAFHFGRRFVGLPSVEAPLRKADAPWLVAVIVFGGMIGPLLLMLGLARIGASTGSLLLNLEGLATMGIAWLVFRENVDRRLLLGAAAILAGAVVLSWTGGGLDFNTGAFLIAGACLAWGIDNNLTRRLSSADPVQIAMLKGLVAGTVNMGLALVSGAHLPSPLLTLAGGAIGLVGVGVSLVMFILALRHLGTARTGAYFSFAPFIGAMLALAMFREPMTWSLAAAAILMGIGLWLHLAERHEHIHIHEELEHEHLHVHDAHHRHSHPGPTTEPHTHWHRHPPLRHDHPHYPDIHHRHRHS